MIKIDLITGFLGAGKTTFMKKYARYLIESGQKICILENDFGAVNVDMLLLQDMLSEQCDLEMVAGGCDADCHKRRFKTKLISMGMRGFDRVLVEPSGIFDMDEFFDTLREEPLEQWYEIGNVIAIVDARLEENLSTQAQFLLASETAGAGQVILSRVQEAESTDIEHTLTYLNKAMEQVQCKRRFQTENGDGVRPKDVVLAKDWDSLTKEDYEKILHSGYASESYQKMWLDKKDAFTSLYFMHVKMSEQDMREAVEKLFATPACGNIFRVKGFLLVAEDSYIEFNATREKFSSKPVEKGQEVFIVIGENLTEAAIKEVFHIQEQA